MSTLAADLRGETTADRARLADLDAQILDLKRSLSALRSQRQPVFERLDAYRYPVLTLPNEIITEIFLYFVPILPVCAPLMGLHSPILLTQICREWRQIALGTPNLWCTIELSDEIPWEQQKTLVDMWLSKSGCSPLSFYFDESAMHSDNVTDTLSVLLSHRARWQNSHLYLSRAHLPIIEGPLPLLRSLDLLLVDTGPLPPNVSLCDAPLLRTVFLNSTAAAILMLPWVQLTSLTLRWLYPHNCVPILQHASSLVHYELVFVPDDTPELIPDISLPSLHSLTLDGYSRTEYLQTLIVPALRTLRISEPFLAPGGINTLARFTSKSRCQLHELCIIDREVGSKDSYREAFPLTQKFFHVTTANAIILQD
ncbi:hypothetical protein B0H14DRAFT_3446661 [Mycena olivaceomarginata]|nr:hypothetical protein B0H14DRAFT_3446661 [Mycena olivaceomarginata]